ncbi:MAG TPA: acetoacetate decarboxylase family protein [Solirubrobacterales bacterium]|nr:acetoacetate decarboxylase family protein [Solirubrobacterales bacterium]
MGFVKTPEEVARIEATLAAPRFAGAQLLSVEFLSDPAFVAAVLPPPLEAVEQPRMRAMAGRWESNCVGDFHGGTIYVAARHQGIEGEYQLSQFIDRDVPTIFGRDLFGEPKKFGASGLRRRGGHFRAWIERDGLRLVELEGEIDRDRGPFTGAGYSFNFKSRPAADGRGLQEDAILTRMRTEVRASVSLTGSAEMNLRGSVHDPLDQIPIDSLTRATYLEADLVASCEAVARTPAAVFAPYHHGRNDDWSAHDTEATRP